MAKIKIGTFNIENLFLRYKLLENEKGSMRPKPIDWEKFKEEGGTILYFGVSLPDVGPISKASRKLTAKVITANQPDVLALQEVENLEALLQFNRDYLKKGYPYAMVVDGNDPRQIDVGILSKFPIQSFSSHRFDKKENGMPVFSRDCLIAEIQVAKGKLLTVFVNHFKSKIGGGGEKRKLQADRVLEIAKERFGKTLTGGDFVIMGDLNDNYDSDDLKSLVQHKKLENVIMRLPEEERWTHYYKKDKAAEQLDYIILSPSLNEKNKKAKPFIERRGLGNDIDIYDGERFNASISGTEGASDHCAIFIELTL
jgi:endonuclease/exonuclease/phosphatase family metal-dependent hydrolase